MRRLQVFSFPTGQTTESFLLCNNSRPRIIMKKLRLSLAVLCAMTALAQAQVYSPIVGFNTITALGESDTRLSAPLHRPPVYQGLVQSVAGNVITVQGLPGWTANMFLYNSPAQTNTHYVSVGNGNKKGMYYTITANSADSGSVDTTTLTVDTAGDVIEGASGLVQGDSISIVPYWTLSTLFPGQVGITTTTSAGGSGAATKVYFPNLTAVGKNLAPPFYYFYYSGTGGSGPSWRRSGSGTAVMNDQIIPPDVPVTIRQDGVGTADITVTGVVPASDRAYVLSTLAANTDQDNAIAIDVPVAMTLAQSNLVQSGAFVGTTSAGGASGGDRLFVYDNTTVGKNKSPSIYFYYTGTTNGPAWRRIGGGTAVQDNVQVFQPGNGYVIRKAAAASAYSVVWTLTPPYLSAP